MESNDTLQSLLFGAGNADDRTALVQFRADDARRWSYTELADRVERIARHLCAAGVASGEPVALLGPNSAEWVAACLAIIRAGGVAMPLDVQLDDDALVRILEDSRPQFAMASPDAHEQLDGIGLDNPPRVITLDDADKPDAWGVGRDDNAPRQMCTAKSDDPAVLFYTSGTTGPPKGVPLTHGNIAFQVDTLIGTGLATASDRVLLPLPLHHVYPFVFGMLTPLALRIPIVMPHRLTGAELTRALREGDVTAVVGVPRLYRALYEGIESRLNARANWAGGLFRRMLRLSETAARRLDWDVGKLLLWPVRKQIGPSVRIVASGGSALAPELAWKLRALGWDVATGYGLTETAPLLTLNLPHEPNYASAGRPIAGVELRIDRDWRTARGAPEDEEERDAVDEDELGGEVLARGPNVFKGYRNLPEKTGKVLSEDGWFRTGDLGWCDDRGFLHLTGRASTLIVTESGTNVQPDQIEELYTNDPRIAEMGVLEHNNRLVAVIVPDLSEIRRRGDDPEESARAAVDEQSRRLPTDQRISDFVLSRRSLPRTRLGKIRRHLLPERYEQAARDQNDDQSSGPVALDEMSREDRKLLDAPAARAVWDWLGERYADRRLSPDTDLRLDLGIDSLEWVSITMEVGQRMGVDLPGERIQELETVRDLLQIVAAEPPRLRGAEGRSPLEAPEEFIDERQRQWLQPHGRVLAGLSTVGHTANRLLMGTLFRVQAKGLSQVAPLLETGSAVLTPNHVSYLDAFAIAAVLKQRWLQRLYWAGWTGIVFRGPFSRTFSRLARVLPVEGEGDVTASLALGAAVLKRGENLVWFPEGERSPSGELQRFQPGVGMLLEHFRVPAVPVYIQGTHEVLPPGRWFPRLRRVTVLFGSPVETETLRHEGLGEVSRVRIADGLRGHVEELKSRSAKATGE